MTHPSVRLLEVAQFNPATPKGLLASNEEVAFVPMAAVSELGFIEVQAYRPANTISPGLTYFENGDVIVAKITPCYENNKICEARIDRARAFGSTEFHVIRPASEKLDARYLLHFLRQDAVREVGMRRMTGSAGQRRVPRSFLEQLEIPLLPLAEQRRIAAILDQADALRRKRLEALTFLDELGRSRFKCLFGDPVTNDRCWPVATLGAVLSGIDGGWSPTCLDRPATSDEWGVLKLGAVTYGRYDELAQKALPPDQVARLGLEVRAGDLLFARKNTHDLVAACALVRETRGRLMLPDLIFRLKIADEGQLNPEYLCALLSNHSQRKEVQKLASGAAGSMPNISKGRLLQLPIILPPPSLQLMFALEVQRQEATRKAMISDQAKLDALFASLQHRCFRGEL